MTPPVHVVAVNGSVSLPSRTLALTQALVAELERHLRITSHVINLSHIARPLGAALERRELPTEVEEQLQAIESADLLLVATPVYRGSYPGHFKHLFDLVGQEALVDKPVLLAATGGSERHALVIDHQLRPLFSFLQAVTLPIGVYASTSDFHNYRVADGALQERIRLAVGRALPFFEGSHRTGLRRVA